MTIVLFDEYFEQIKSNTTKLYFNYMGINKKEYPKWEGWKIINKYKEQGIDIKNISDERLEILVKNFYYIKYLSN